MDVNPILTVWRVYFSSLPRISLQKGEEVKHAMNRAVRGQPIATSYGNAVLAGESRMIILTRDTRRKGKKIHVIFQTPFRPLRTSSTFPPRCLSPAFPFPLRPNECSTAEPRKTRATLTSQLPPIHKRKNNLLKAILYSPHLSLHPLPSSPPLLPRPPLPGPVLNQGSHSPPFPNSLSILVGRAQAEQLK